MSDVPEVSMAETDRASAREGAGRDARDARDARDGRLDREPIEACAVHINNSRGSAKAGGNQHVPVVTAVCSVLAAVAVRVIHRSFLRLRARLQDTEKQCEELTAACSASQAKIDELVRSLEEKARDLAEKERCLEQMRVEQQLSKSMAGLVERELKTTKKLLASYQGQLDQATYVLKENNRQNENLSDTPGAMGFRGGSFWG